MTAPDELPARLLPREMSVRRYARLVVRADALLTVQEAAALIGGRGARAWIEQHVPMRYAAGQRRVLWRDVIEATDVVPPGGERPKPKPPRHSKIRIADY